MILTTSVSLASSCFVKSVFKLQPKQQISSFDLLSWVTDVAIMHVTCCIRNYTVYCVREEKIYSPVNVFGLRIERY